MIEEVSKVADAYAQGLLLAGIDDGSVSDLLAGAATLLEVFHQEPRFEVFLAAPHIPVADKERLLSSLPEERVPTLLYRLVVLVVRRHRGMHLRDILIRFREIATEDVGRVPALIQSAIPLSRGLKRRVEKTLEQITKRDLDIQWQVDRDLLGGLRISFEDFLVDGTIRKSLQMLRASLMAEKQQ